MGTQASAPELKEAYFLVRGPSAPLSSELIAFKAVQQHQPPPAKEHSSYLMIDSPSENDIFLGKGKRSKRLRGNSLFRQAVEQHAQAYSAGDRREKIKVLHGIYTQLKDAGCRFLKEQTSTNRSTKVVWMEVSEEEALEKIAMGIQNYQRKLQGATSAANNRRRRLDGSSSSISSNDSSSSSS